MNSVIATALAVIAALFQLSFSEARGDAPQVSRELPPSAFAEVPAPIRRELARRGCSIPQPVEERRANVIRGDFHGRGQVDWAALCSRNQSSSILVFRNGSAAAIEELARRPNQSYVQEVEPGRMGFSRAIRVAAPAFILEHYRWYAGPKPPALSHSGIEDAFIGKASVVWFWHRGRWLQLTGTD